MKRVPAPLTQPWAITAEGMELVLAVWSRGDLFAEAKERALQARDGAPLENTRAVTMREGVAVIPIYGPLFRHASMLTALSGATSYADVRKDLQRAIDDPQVKAILLDVNSPGGEVDGCGELADAIYAVRAAKPVEAYVGGMGASAAYWLGSAASKITCSESALLGSIGVRSAVVDTSESEKQQGIRTVEIISSQSPGKRDRPVDDEVVARAQQVVDDLAAVFIGAVARHRGVTTQAVEERFGQGGVIVGARAVAAGLADDVGNLESVIARLSKQDSRAGPLVSLEKSLAPSSGWFSEMAANSQNKDGGQIAATKGDEMKTNDKNKLRAEGDDMPKDAEEKKDEQAETDEEKKDAPEGKAEEKCADEDEEEKKDDEEQAAARALAAKLGLPANASVKDVLLAANIGAVPAAQMTKLVDARVAAALAEEKAKLAAAEAKSRAEALAAEAIQGGYAEEDRGALVAFASQNFAAAEKLVSPYLAKSRQIFGRMTVGGAPTGAARPVEAAPSESPNGVVKSGRGLSAAIAEYRKANPKASYEDAAIVVARKHPELAASYFNGQ
jgi:signal peptide peptidase SppA